MPHVTISLDLAPAVSAALHRALASEPDYRVRRDAGDALVEMDRQIKEGGAEEGANDEVRY